jgi:hypothetical protein
LFETPGAAQNAARSIREDAAWREGYRVLVAPLIATGIERLMAEA